MGKCSKCGSAACMCGSSHSSPAKFVSAGMMSGMMGLTQDQRNAQATAQNAQTVAAQNAYNASVQNGMQHQKAGMDAVKPNVFSPTAQENMTALYNPQLMPPQPAAPMGQISDVDTTGMNSLYGSSPFAQTNTSRKDRIEAKYESAEPGSDRSKRLGAKYEFMNERDWAKQQFEKGYMSRKDMRSFIKEERGKKRLNKKS